MVALSLGLLMGLFHLVWSILVMLGSAQALLDWIYGLHFLNNPFMVSQFEITKAATLVIVTFAVGYVAGWVFAWIWNMWAKKK